METSRELKYKVGRNFVLYSLVLATYTL